MTAGQRERGNVGVRKTQDAAEGVGNAGNVGDLQEVRGVIDIHVW